MAEQSRTRDDDPFLLSYTADELRTASEFLTNWMPFLSRGLCLPCVGTLSDRIRSLDHGADRHVVRFKQQEDVAVSRLENTESNGSCTQENCDAHSIGSWKDEADFNDTADKHSLGSWKEDADGSPEPVSEVSMRANSSGRWKDGPSRTSDRVSMREKFNTPVSRTSGRVSVREKFTTPVSVGRQGAKMSWADMAQEDEVEVDEDTSSSSLQLDNGCGLSLEGASEDEFKPKNELSRERREYIRFSNVKRKKDFICLERINGKIVNILDGLELHTGVFSAAEQIRIVDYVEELRNMGKNGLLKARTYTAPQKWMRGKGRVTIQFGCCYNYATDKNGNPPGILKDDIVDPIPQLLKVMIKRLVRWHVLPPNCIPDSCIVNIYEEGDCIPPHIDNHDFVRPFCTVSFLSEGDIVFGSDLKILGPGEFDGPFAIPLPVGSVLVLNGKGADVAKHCVPAVPTERISITFRRMDESKRPIGYVPEPDLQGLQPLSDEMDESKKSETLKPRYSMNKQVVRRENMSKLRRSTEWNSEPRYSRQTQQWQATRQRVRVDLERSADNHYSRTVRF